jgi:hypothetical protein
MNPRLASVSTVIEPASSRNLVSVGVVKAVLGITDGSLDDFLTTAIKFVSAAIAQYCNRELVVETVKDEFWPARDSHPYQVPGGIAPLQLKRWPIVEDGVSAVVEDGVTLVDSTDYRVDYANGQLIRLDGAGYPTQWPARAIAVTYDAGFSAIPADVQDAAVRMVNARLQGRGRDPNLRQESIPGVREVQYWIPNSPTGNMAPDIEDLLDNYRVPVIA